MKADRVTVASKGDREVKETHPSSMWSRRSNPKWMKSASNCSQFTQLQSASWSVTYKNPSFLQNWLDMSGTAHQKSWVAVGVAATVQSAVCAITHLSASALMRSSAPRAASPLMLLQLTPHLSLSLRLHLPPSSPYLTPCSKAWAFLRT